MSIVPSATPEPEAHVVNAPLPGSSPLVEQIGSEVTQINIMPGFGGLLQVAMHSTSGMPEAVPGAVAAVTVYGDGRIEYHPAPAAGDSR